MSEKLPGALDFSIGYFTQTPGISEGSLGPAMIDTSYTPAKDDAQKRAVSMALQEQLDEQNRLDPRIDYSGPISPYSNNTRGYAPVPEGALTPEQSNSERASRRTQGTGEYSDEYVLKSIAPAVYQKILGTSR